MTFEQELYYWTHMLDEAYGNANNTDKMFYSIRAKIKKFFNSIDTCGDYKQGYEIMTLENLLKCSKDEQGKSWLLPSGLYVPCDDTYHSEIQGLFPKDLEAEVMNLYGIDEDFCLDNTGMDTPFVYEAMLAGCIRVSDIIIKNNGMWAAVDMHIAVKPSNAQIYALYDIADLVKDASHFNANIDIGLSSYDVDECALNIDYVLQFNENGREFYRKAANEIKKLFN